MIEPKRVSDINSLVPYIKTRVESILKELKELGFDPIIYEARRSDSRQKWLYGIGRTHSKKRKPVTWTLNSKHIVGKAVDIISKSKGWDYPKFFKALRIIARKHDMHTLKSEECHIEWRG